MVPTAKKDIRSVSAGVISSVVNTGLWDIIWKILKKVSKSDVRLRTQFGRNRTQIAKWLQEWETIN